MSRESEISDVDLVGWQVYGIEEEFERQKAGCLVAVRLLFKLIGVWWCLTAQVNDKWTAYRMNTSYELCPSYPQMLYMPADLQVLSLNKHRRSSSALWFGNVFTGPS